LAVVCSSVHFAQQLAGVKGVPMSSLAGWVPHFCRQGHAGAMQRTLRCAGNRCTGGVHAFSPAPCRREGGPNVLACGLDATFLQAGTCRCRAADTVVCRHPLRRGCAPLGSCAEWVWCRGAPVCCACTALSCIRHASERHWVFRSMPEADLM
jgi:hypothetical protein